MLLSHSKEAFGINSVSSTLYCGLWFICMILFLHCAVVAGESVATKCLLDATRWQGRPVHTDKCCAVFKAEAAECAVVGRCVSTDVAGDCRRAQVQRNICRCHGANSQW